MANRELELTKFIGVEDVMGALGCSKSLAYRHLRRAAGRPAGSRGLLRVPLATWEQYANHEWSGSAPAREPSSTVRRRSLRELDAAQTALHVPVTQPRRRATQ